MKTDVAEREAVEEAARQRGTKTISNGKSSIKANDDGIVAYKTKKGLRFRFQLRVKGRKYQSGSGFATRAEAVQALTTAKAAGDKVEVTLDVEQQEMRLGDQVDASGVVIKCGLFTTYVETCAAKKIELEYSSVRNFARLNQHPLLKNVRMVDLDIPTLITYLQDRRDRDGLSKGTLLKDFIRINVAMKMVTLWKQWKPNIAILNASALLRKEHLIKEGKTRMVRPTAEQLDALVKYFIQYTAEAKARKRTNAKIVPMEIITAVCALNGFRRAEITRLLRSKVTPNGNAIWLWRKDSSDEADKSGPNKGRRLVMVPLLPEVTAILKALPVIGGKDAFFPYTPKLIGDRFTRACKALGFEDLHLHDMRREAISNFSQFVQDSQGMAISGHKCHEVYLGYRVGSEEYAARIAEQLSEVRLKTAATA